MCKGTIFEKYKGLLAKLKLLYHSYYLFEDCQHRLASENIAKLAIDQLYTKSHRLISISYEQTLNL